MQFPRSSGVLLHPTSLPGRLGIGELGDAAYRFVDFLAAAGQQLWQVMPLGPTGYGDSPYASPSAFAGNPLLVSLELLAADGLLSEEQLATAPAGDPALIDFGAVIPWKLNLLRQAFERWRSRPDSESQLDEFVSQEQFWLPDYALFMAIKEQHGGSGWGDWAPELRQRDTQALDRARSELADDIRFREFIQYQFYRQWGQLRAYANERNVKIIGDIPIFAAYDSADVWANPDLFYLDEQGQPTVVAGVPPDYFSATGQRWGNPLYRWDVMARQDYRWWAERFRQTFKLVDIVRIDHFRGFEAYWEVPAEEETALNGQWVPGPGAALFESIEAQLGPLPIIAEDLGLITPEVNELRLGAGFPGMRVLQFAFDGHSDNEYLPYNYEAATVVYTGTHDNDTSVGWFRSLDERSQAQVLRYIGQPMGDFHWEFIRLALASVAEIAIVPLQDVLGLGSEARMNTPGRESGNWGWRFRAEALNTGLAAGLADMAAIYGRLPEAPEAEEAAEDAAQEQG